MLLKFNGLKRVTKYRVVSETQPHPPHNVIYDAAGYSEYMLVLEFANRQDFEAYEASAELKAASEEGSTHDWGGLHEKRRRVQFELVSDWGRQP